MMVNRSEQPNIPNIEESKKQSQMARAVGNIVLGATLAMGAAGTAAAAHLGYELHTMEISVDPLGLERNIDNTTTAIDYEMTPVTTEIPSLDEAPRENPFLDGIHY